MMLKVEEGVEEQDYKCRPVATATALRECVGMLCDVGL